MLIVHSGVLIVVLWSYSKLIVVWWWARGQGGVQWQTHMLPSDNAWWAMLGAARHCKPTVHLATSHPTQLPMCEF